jgi:hypothetical protein
LANQGISVGSLDKKQQIKARYVKNPIAVHCPKASRQLSWNTLNPMCSHQNKSICMADFWKNMIGYLQLFVSNVGIWSYNLEKCYIAQPLTPLI